MQGDEPADEAGKRRWIRYLPIAAIVIVMGAIFALGLNNYISLQALRDNREMLAGFVSENQIQAVLAYISAYALMIVFIPPSGTVMTLVGGLLFGAIVGGAITVIGATLGASMLFIAAQTAFGDILRDRAGPAIVKMEQGFQRNAASYMLFLRLVPAFPFFIVNLAPAFLGVPLRTFVWTTAIGIIPGTFVYASLGAGLGAIIGEQDPDLGLIFEPRYLLPIVGLALLALIPVIVNRKKSGADS